MTDQVPDPAGPPGSVRSATRARRAAAPASPDVAAAPAEVTATVVPRRRSGPAGSPVRSSQPPPAAAAPAAAGAEAAPVAAPAVSASAVPMASAGSANAIGRQLGNEHPGPAPGQPAPAADPAPDPGPDDGAGRSGGRGRRTLHLGQVVCWQLVAALIAVSVGRATWIIAVAVLTGTALVALTSTWHRDLWTYQWVALRLRYLVRDHRFVPIEAIHRTIEVGDTDAAILVRPSGITAVLEVAVPSVAPDPAGLLERHPDLEAKLLVQRDRAWIALTATRTVARHTDVELELLLANAVRRLVGRPRHPSPTHRPLTSEELAEVLARLTPDRAQEDWDGLRLWTGRYRMYEAAADLAAAPPGAVVLTYSGELDHALVLVPADAAPPAGAVPLTGRQRRALTAALP